MKRLLTTLAIAPLFLAQPALAELGPWYGHSAYYEQHRQERRLDAIDARQARQREAVERGVARGSITPQERARLNRRLVHIVNVERIYKSDGHFTAHERARVTYLQDIAEREIRLASHDRDRRRYF